MEAIDPISDDEPYQNTFDRKAWRPSPASVKARRERLAAARSKGRHTAEEWREMVAAYKMCLRCGDTESTLCRDHIVPIYQGGDDSIRNLQPLCIRCNSSKGPDTTDFRVGRRETKPVWISLDINPYAGGLEVIERLASHEPPSHSPTSRFL